MEGTSKNRSGVAGKLAKGGGRAIPIAALGAFAASALAAFAAHSAPNSAPRFAVRTVPSQQTVRAGSVARFQLSINQRNFRGSISFSAGSAPRYSQARLARAGRSQRTLTVATSSRTPVGRYVLVVLVHDRAINKAIRLALTVLAPRPVSIGISGSVAGLQPGAPAAMDLVLRNPSALNLSVTGLTVTAKSVSAPESTALLPCTLADFSMRQFSGTYPLALPPSSTHTLSSLGVPPAQRPQVTLINRPFNQDGCQGASVVLTYSGRGVAR